MKKLLAVVILAFILFSCVSQERGTDAEIAEVPSVSIFDSLFVSHSLQDSLNLFMASIDTVAELYRPKKFYNIQITRYENKYKKRIDTLLEFHANLGLSFVPGTDADYTPIGAVSDSNKVVTLVYKGFDSLPEIVQENRFDMDVYFWYTSLDYSTQIQCFIEEQEAMWNYREYKIEKGEMLIPLRIDQSYQVNPNVRGWSDTIYDARRTILGGGYYF